MRSIPRMASWALVAIVASKSIGAQVQKYVTTRGEVGRLNIRDIGRVGVGGLTVHRVRTSSED